MDGGEGTCCSKAVTNKLGLVKEVTCGAWIPTPWLDDEHFGTTPSRISKVEVVLVLLVDNVMLCGGASEIALTGSRKNPNSPS